jgi:hypothetical protein
MHLTHNIKQFDAALKPREEGSEEEVSMEHFGRMLTFFGPIREADSGNILIIDRVCGFFRC